MTESKKGQNRVVVYPDWCKSCGICIAFCPKHVLASGPDGKARVVDEAACINCGFCELHCPDFAIVVTPREANGRHNGHKPSCPGGAPAEEAAPAQPGQNPPCQDADKEERA